MTKTYARRSHWGVAAAATLPLVLVAGCGANTGDGNAASAGGAAGESTVQIGAVYPQSGPIALQGTATLVGARYAVEQINANGGIEALDGAHLELVERDAGDSPESATAAATELIQGGDIDVLMGAWLGTYSTAIAPVAERAGMPFVTEAFGDDLTENGYKHVNDISPRSSTLAGLQLTAMDDLFADADADLETIVVGGDNGFSTVPLREAFVAGLEERGVEILANEEWTSPLRDPSSFLNTVRSEDPDAVLLVGYTYGDNEAVVSALRGAGFEKPIIANGGQAALPAWLETGDIVEGLITQTAYGPIAGAVDAAEGMAELGDVPYAYQEHFLGYTDVYVIKEALELAGSTEASAVSEALRNLDVTDGPLADAHPTGSFSFDDTGRVDGDFAIVLQWQSTPEGQRPCVVWPENAKTCEVQL